MTGQELRDEFSRRLAAMSDEDIVKAFAAMDCEVEITPPPTGLALAVADYRLAAENAGIDLRAYSYDKECGRYHAIVLAEVDQKHKETIRIAAEEEAENKRCGDSYLRMRQKLKEFGALDTNSGGENRFEVTEVALDKALEELRRIKRGIINRNLGLIVNGYDMKYWGWEKR